MALSKLVYYSLSSICTTGKIKKNHPSYDELDYDKYGLRRVWGGIIVMPDIRLVSNILNHNFKEGEIILCPLERFAKVQAECDTLQVIEKFVETLWHYRNHSEITDQDYDIQMKLLTPLKALYTEHKWG